MLTTSQSREGTTSGLGTGLSEAEIREHLDVVLASDDFISSRRASELLQHLVSRTLQGDTSSLKERLLGVEIFHRRSDYNTSTDAIVRVTANDVRRRLSHFYAKQPTHSPRISLPLGSYVPDFIPARPEADTATPPTQTLPVLEPAKTQPPSPTSQALPAASASEIPLADPKTPISSGGHKLSWLAYAFGLLLAAIVGWQLNQQLHPRNKVLDRDYSFYRDLLGPIGLDTGSKTEITLTDPHVLLYLGLNSPGPALGVDPIDIPVSIAMESVLNKTANDKQATFPFHHFFVDSNNYTGMGEATAAFGLARTLEAIGRDAQLTEERFLNWETARQEQLVILGAPHESAFVQNNLSAANFTIGYDSIHNAHPLPGEKADYSRSRNGDSLEDYGLIWMTKSPSGTRILVLAGLSSPGTAGVGEFFNDPEKMKPVYEQLRAASKSGTFPESWQVLLRIDARQDIPVSITPIATRITPAS